MSHFTGPLVLREIGYELWEVEKSFALHSDLGLVVFVEAGFVTDLASIPGIAHSFVHKVGYWSQGATVHDLCYNAHRNGMLVARNKVTGDFVDITRNQADRMFREGCRVKEQEYNIPIYKQRTTILYSGVVAGGAGSWETREEREERMSLFDNSDIIDD
jgi:hypothetical protein